MAETNWRKRARKVATLDWIFTILESFFSVVALPKTLFQAWNKSGLDPDGRPTFLLAIVTFVVIIIMLSDLFLVKSKAAFSLRLGTEKVIEAEEAWDWCKTWRNSCIIVLGIYCGIYFLTLNLTTMAIAILIRIAFLFIVYKFMMQLQIPPKPLAIPREVLVGTRGDLEMSANIIQGNGAPEPDTGARDDDQVGPLQ